MEIKQEYDPCLEKILNIKQEPFLIDYEENITNEDLKNMQLFQNEFSMDIKKEPQKTLQDFHSPLEKLKEESDEKIGVLHSTINNSYSLCSRYDTKGCTEFLSTDFDKPTVFCKNTYSFTKPSSSKQLKNSFKVIPKKYSCPVCQKDFIFSKSRLKHFIGHFLKGFVICGFCGNIFKEKTEFLNHYFVHLVKSTRKSIKLKRLYKCNVCYEQFTHKSSLNRHLKCHTVKKIIKCEFCSKKYATNLKLKRHLKMHTAKKPFKCKICFKQFISKSNLSQHLVVHSKLKPFKCGICSKQFTQKSSLRRHLKLHTGEKPFKCKICYRAFTVKFSLKQHVRIHSGEKRIKCEMCPKKFRINKELVKHLKTHAGEKPFSCEICSYQTKYRSNLNKHLGIHTDQKQFACKICNKQFTFKSNLTAHLKVHSGQKTFKCKICSNQFRYTSNLNRHHLKFHGDLKPLK